MSNQDVANNLSKVQQYLKYIMDNIFVEIKRGETFMLKGKLAELYNLTHKDDKIVDLFLMVLRAIGANPKLQMRYPKDMFNTHIIIHSALMKRGFDEYCETIEFLMKEFHVEHQMRWILASPVIKKSQELVLKKYEDSSGRFLHILSLVMMSNVWMTGVNEQLIQVALKDLNDIIKKEKAKNVKQPTELFSEKNILSLSVIESFITCLYHLIPSNYKYNRDTRDKLHNLYIYGRKTICKYIKDTIGKQLEDPDVKAARQFHEKTIAVIVQNPADTGSDFKGVKSFIMAAKNRGYKLHCYHPQNVVDECISPLYDKAFAIISDTDIRHIMENQYPFAFYVNHMSYPEMLGVPCRLGKVQIGFLGHIVTSALPDMDYFTMPAWDNPENYTEKPLLLSHMACSLPNVTQNTSHETFDDKDKKLDNTADDTLVLAMTLTGCKTTPETCQMLRKISQKLTSQRIKHKFMLLLGERKEDVLHIHVIDEIHYSNIIDDDLIDSLEEDCDEEIDSFASYELVYNNRENYFKALERADIIMLPYPYSPYISAIDCLKYSKPIVILKDEIQNITQCGARIFELFGLNELVVNSKDEYYNRVVELATNLDMRQQITKKLQSIDYNQKINQFNKKSEDEFHAWLVSQCN